MRPRGKAGKVGNPTSAEEERLVGGGAAVGTRKKGFGVRAWLVIDAEGCADVMEAGKHVIMRRTGLPARDLRILDPLLSYPSTILGREHAIVVNLEHIKAIVTAREVLLLNSKDPSVSPLVLELQRRLPNFYNEFGQPPPPPTHQQLAGFGEGCFGDLERDVYNNKPTSGSSPPAVLRKRFESQSQQPKNEVLKIPKPPVESDLNVSETKMGLKDLPFEFRALEVCLESACRCLDSETTILEQEAYPALDELTSKISTLNLERVRQIKSRLVAISGRVQKVRDELEHLLDDDGDMAEMYLSDKLARQLQDGLQYPLSANGSPTNTPRPEMHHVGADGMEREGRPLNGYELEKSNSHSSSDSSSRRSDSQQLDVAELEMLLEAYFVQIDGTLNKLSTLREYVDDTEDYINIMLDDKQNHLLQMGVMMTTATLVISGSVVVTGLFGMNIHIDLFDNGALPQFLWTVLGSIAASILVYILVIGWCKWKRLLE